MTNCIQELSADTILLYNKLITIETDKEITYEELSKVIKRDIRHNGNIVLLNTARKKAMKDDNIVFGTIRNRGLKRLSDTEIVDNSSASFLSIQRATKRESRKLIAVDFQTLPQDKKIKHSASAAALAVIHEMAAPKQIKVIENKIKDSNAKLSMIQTIDAIREAEGGL